ncbi:hypothetical protein [Rariglobus hedericola]|uniref:Uncharacterized protein n=1 Tax=Rariglobus hedericola TaxID=2597822 RepID=A0A556QK86_9BACT|nr:hypothetical protein [Rariglobus hedericola]TSJ77038.1 hypothetical protein FPL22_13080 [Rariglobus hedericola]
MITENGIPLTASNEVRIPFYRSLSWRAIIAGTVAGLAVHLLLTLLGIGVGAGMVDPITDENPFAAFSLSAAIAWGVSALIALGVGGWVAGRFVPNGSKHSGCLHGFLVWSLATIAVFVFATSSLGLAIGGAAKVVGQGVQLAAKPVAAAASGATDLAKDALQQNQDTVKSFLDEAMDSRPDKDNAAKTTRARREIGYAVTKLFTPGNDVNAADTRAAVTRALVEQGGMNEADANRLVSEWTTSYERLKSDLAAAKEKAEVKAREAAEKASKALAHAAIWTFIAFLLGAVVSSIAGKCGASCRCSEDDVRRV